MSEREKLMRELQRQGFAMFDAHLFLDSHPASRQVLAFYRKRQAMYDQLAAEYGMKFGPLTAGMQTNENAWDWVDGPWPWEYVE